MGHLVPPLFVTFSLQPNFRPLLSQTWQHPKWQLELPNSRAAHTWRHILGQWRQHLPWWAIFYQNPIIPLPLSALQCRLDCNPGYVAHKAPIITCVNGQYQPQARLWQESEPLKDTIFFANFAKTVANQTKTYKLEVGMRLWIMWFHANAYDFYVVSCKYVLIKAHIFSQST